MTLQAANGPAGPCTSAAPLSLYAPIRVQADEGFWWWVCPPVISVDRERALDDVWGEGRHRLRHRARSYSIPSSHLWSFLGAL